MSSILNVFILVIGLFSVITNGFYILINKEVELGRRQHRELPESASEFEVKTKVNLMFISGLMFCIAFILNTIKSPKSEIFLLFTLSLFFCYSLLEAQHYKHWKTWGFSFVSVFLLLIYLFL